MPTYRDITVHVTDDRGRSLEEWGVRERHSAKQTSCYIESKTDTAFWIGVKAEIPYPEQVYLADDGREVPDWPAKWHLLATLRLDGRPDFEKRSIIYLDLAHSYSRDKVIMRSRAVPDEDGNYRNCSWVFKEVGIEHVFDGLKLSDEATPVHDADELSNAFGKMDAEFQEGEERTTAGQIEVTIERITVGEQSQRNPNDHKAENHAMDTVAGGLANLSHTVAREAGVQSYRRMNNTYIPYEMYQPSETPWATFKFYYRSEDELRKYGF